MLTDRCRRAASPGDGAGAARAWGAGAAGRRLSLGGTILAARTTAGHRRPTAVSAWCLAHASATIGSGRVVAGWRGRSATGRRPRSCLRDRRRDDTGDAPRAIVVQVGLAAGSRRRSEGTAGTAATGASACADRLPGGPRRRQSRGALRRSGDAGCRRECPARSSVPAGDGATESSSTRGLCRRSRPRPSRPRSRRNSRCR